MPHDEQEPAMMGAVISRIRQMQAALDAQQLALALQLRKQF